jgi:2-polyprenyl-3-methyl-5-hydroxy-6-metoxy-1,4-benzoquinol methylase
LYGKIKGKKGLVLQMIDEDYTKDDHINRENDLYALLKYDLTLEYLKKFGLNSIKKDRILNIGCGAGDFNLIAHSQNFRCDGFDSDSSAIDIAIYKNVGLDNRIVLSDIETATQVFNNYSFLVCHDVLEHVEYDKVQIKKIKSFCNPLNSIIVISVPAFQFLFGQHDVKLGHYRRYSRRQIINLIKDDFEILDSRYVGFLGFFAVFLISKVFKSKFPSNGNKLGRFLLRLTSLVEKKVRFPLGSSVMVVGRIK